jgi:hypothetical protein
VKLIQQGQEWVRPPEPQKLASGKDTQVVLASWSNSEITRPLEHMSDHADSNHVMSLAPRCTKSELFIGGKKLRAGTILAGRPSLQARFPRRCGTVFLRASSSFRSTYRPGLLDARHQRLAPTTL